MKRGMLILALTLAACSGSHGSKDKVTTFGFADSSTFVRSRVVRRVHHDGSESVHGETLHDYAPNVAITLRVIEDVDLDKNGALKHADIKIWNTYGTTDQKKRVILDPAAGTLKVTRPGGSAIWSGAGSE